MYRQSADDLGALESEHPFAPGWSKRLLGIALASLALGIALLMFMTDGLAPHNRKSFSSESEQWAVSLAVSGLFFALGVGLLVARWLQSSASARLHEDAIVYSWRGKTTTIRWSDLKHLWSMETIRNGVEHFQYKLEDKSGRVMRISPRLASVRSIALRAGRALATHRLPEATKAHAAGEHLRFGDLLLSAQGLTMGGAELRWTEILSASRSSTQITIWKRGGEAKRFSRAAVPNVDILFDLLREHVELV